MWESVIVLCFVVCFYAHSSFAIILMRNRELIALLSLSSWCLVIDGWLFLVVQWVCLQFVIVVFPDHTIFYMSSQSRLKSACILIWYDQRPSLCAELVAMGIW